MNEQGFDSFALSAPVRQALADDVSASHGVAYAAENVAVQPGGKPVIEKFLLTLMDPGDEVLYPSPGFPIYESQIEFLGGVAETVGREGETLRRAAGDFLARLRAG